MPILKTCFVVVILSTLMGCTLALKAPDLPLDHPASPGAAEGSWPPTADHDSAESPSMPTAMPDAPLKGGHDDHKH